MDAPPTRPDLHRALDEARRGRPRAPIVALPANAMKGDADACLAAGMDAHLAKPIAPQVLRDLVALHGGGFSRA